ncbi:hypothetical protein ACIA59_05205 [Micromonospora haikouensis]|uniref:hypothetical protein n=1 Tax=Micromonospora haikouensis TaxID=686309 RepID=UPI0037986FF7
MLPVALTCPLWWVARWTARTLTTLAVVVAFSLGAASLPPGTMLPAGVDPGQAGSGPAVAAASASVAGPAAVAEARTVAASAATGSIAAGSTAAAGAAGPWPPADAPPPAEAGPPQVAAPAPQRVPTGLVPAAVGPRAPPAA